MAAGEAITRAEIGAMSLAEFESREAEIERWAAAGAKDGEPAPPEAQRRAGHVFTLEEVRAMSLSDFAANEDAITHQAPALGQEKAAELKAARARAGR